MTKNEIREKYLNLRNKLSDEEVTEKSRTIFYELSKTNIWEYAYYMLYCALEKQNEPDIGLMAKELWRLQKKVYLPKIKENTMQAVVYDFNTELVKNEWEILEPKEDLIIETEKIDIFLIPMILCDFRGNRVGYGKGYYDRFLTEASPTSLKIGVSFFEPLEELIPTESTDIAMDYCVTPSSFIGFSPKS